MTHPTICSDHPGCPQFEVMDACDLPLPDKDFDTIIDKSLIDTLRCCTGSQPLCDAFISEMHRTLKPDGVFITLSLNDYGYEDMFRYYDKECYDWSVGWVNLPNVNYEPAKENTETYSFIVCSRKHSREALQKLLETFERDDHTIARMQALEAELAPKSQNSEGVDNEYIDF